MAIYITVPMPSKADKMTWFIPKEQLLRKAPSHIKTRKIMIYTEGILGMKQRWPQRLWIPKRVH